MLIFPVFRKLQPRRPPLFSFIGEIPTGSGSPSPVPVAAHIPPSRNTRACYSLANRSHPLALLSFHALTNCKLCNSFVFKFIQNAPGVYPPLFVFQSSVCSSKFHMLQVLCLPLLRKLPGCGGILPILELAPRHPSLPRTSAPLPHCSLLNPSDTIQCLFNRQERTPTADARNPAPQHSVWKSRTLRPAKARRSAHLHLRPHGLRLRPHRQLPHLRFPGYFAALPQAPRFQAPPRHESDRRGRPHHRQRRRCEKEHPRLHRAIRAGLLRRLQN